MISRSAVSRTFTAGASVSAKTRAKVEAAAKRLGYTPNALASSLTTGRTKLIGLIANNFHNPLILEVFNQHTCETFQRFVIFLEQIHAVFLCEGSGHHQRDRRVVMVIVSFRAACEFEGQGAVFLNLADPDARAFYAPVKQLFVIKHNRGGYDAPSGPVHMVVAARGDFWVF